jgi:hypothetical protein
MTDDVIEHEHQATIDGVEPVQTPAGAETAVKAALLGVLLHPAIVRIDSHNRVRLEVVFKQRLEHHPKALPVFASWIYPDLGCFDSTHAAVKAKALGMNTEAEVMVLGRGLEIGRHEGLDVFRVIHVDGIDLTVHH